MTLLNGALCGTAGFRAGRAFQYIPIAVIREAQIDFVERDAFVLEYLQRLIDFWCVNMLVKYGKADAQKGDQDAPVRLVPDWARSGVSHDP